MVKKVEDIPYVQAEIERTLEEFKTRPADAEKLEGVKRHHRYAFLMGLDSPANVAEGLARFIALSGGIEVVDRLYTELEKVAPADVLHATRKYFDPKRRTVAVLLGTK